MEEVKVIFQQLKKKDRKLSIKKTSDETGLNYQRLIKANGGYQGLEQWELEILREYKKYKLGGI